MPVLCLVEDYYIALYVYLLFLLSTVGLQIRCCVLCSKHLSSPSRAVQREDGVLPQLVAVAKNVL